MQLSLQHRHVGYVTVITCRGRIVLGEEADALLKQIDGLLPNNSRILLHLGEVDFIDSGGLGMLVRCLTRVQNAAGQLSICALSPKVSEVLRVTRLDGVLKPVTTPKPMRSPRRTATRTPSTTSLAHWCSVRISRRTCSPTCAGCSKAQGIASSRPRTSTTD